MGKTGGERPDRDADRPCLPGEGISGITEALRRNREGARFIRVRHEDGAALMARGRANDDSAESLAKRTPNRGEIALTVLSDKVRELL